MALSRLLPVRSPRAWVLLLLLLLVTVAAALWRAPAPKVENVPLAAAPGKSSPLPAPEPPAEDPRPQPPAESVAPEAAPPARAVVPHRAAASQRAEDMRRAASETDLPAFAADLEARANAGDADAAWVLAGLLEVCAQALTYADRRQELHDELRNLLMLGFTEDEQPIVERAFEQVIGRCSSFSGETPGSLRRVDWNARAIALGHPGARLQQQRPRVDPQSPQMREFEQQQRLAGIELLQQGDPLDLARFAWALPGYSRYDPDAFTLAACTLVPACAADPGAFTLALIQSQPFAGTSAAFTTLRELSPRRRMITAGQSADIVRLWRARRFEELLGGRPQASSPGGG